MAFASPLSLNNNAAAAKSFERKTVGSNSSDAIEATSTPTDKWLMKMAHQRLGNGAAPGVFMDRHLIQFQRIKFNATLGKDESMTFNGTLLIPTSSGLTTTDIYDGCAFLKNFLSTTNVDRLLRGECQ